ncbi:MAG: 1,4-dihydroxy-2-naphthoate octaprenyltransferase [Bacteroidaceae bacterium]|nr:1,4-dihydroxy-2-naphthoate octaprenyltransferase [Bacteroidaceae bacterium]
MKTNSITAWFLASRPKTLTGAAAPVLVGGAMAWIDCFSRMRMDLMHNMLHPYSAKVNAGFWMPFALCLLFAFLMQIDANLVNDYFDFKKGTDREDRLGPERACAQGWITPGAMKIGIGVCTVLACLVGCVIMLWHLQYELLVVGIACVIGCFIYTTKFSYLGLGDILVLVFFGIVPVGFTYYVISNGQWTLPLTLAGLGMGLATDNLLIVNNYRDRHQDAISGKNTIIVRMGGTFGLRAYLWCGIIATILGMTALYMMDKPYWFMLGYLLLNIMTWYKMCHLDGKALNGVLGKTARNIFLYGLLLAGAMVAA